MEARLSEFNPIEELEPLATNRVEILHLHGDKDNVVPLEPNSIEFAKRYKALGGKIQIKIIPEAGHTPRPEFFESRSVLPFILGEEPNRETTRLHHSGINTMF